MIFGNNKKILNLDLNFTRIQVTFHNIYKLISNYIVQFDSTNYIRTYNLNYICFHRIRYSHVFTFNNSYKQ